MAEATSYFLNDLHVKDVQAINTGWCMDWAERVVAYCGRPKEEMKAVWGCDVERLFTDECKRHAYSHAFVIYNGRYFDSEATQGVNNPEELPCFQRTLRHCREKALRQK